MIAEILKAIWAYSEALFYFIKFKLYKYLLLLLILLVVFAFPVIIFDFLTGLILKLLPSIEEYTLMGLNIAAGISGFLLLLVLSPLFSLVSEEVGVRLGGKEYRFSPVQLMKDVIRGIKISLRNMFYQYLAIVLISLVLYLLPKSNLLQILGNVLIALVTAYFYGFSILDYAMENYRMSYRKSVDFVRSHPGLALGLGGVYYSIISLNNLLEGHLFNAHTSVYWSGFSEALVAFIGVIAASILMYKYQKPAKQTFE